MGNNQKPLSEGVVLVTGALTGISRATAIAFAEEGAKVVLSGQILAVDGAKLTVDSGSIG